MSHYLVLRNRTWHYRRRVPDDVQPFVGAQWWKVSLKITERRLAEQNARVLAVEQDRFIDHVRCKSLRQQYDELEAKGFDLRRQIAEAIKQRMDAALARTLDAALRNALAATLRRLRQEHKVVSEGTLVRGRELQKSMLREAEHRLGLLAVDQSQAIIAAGGLEKYKSNARLYRASASASTLDLINSEVFTTKEKEAREGKRFVNARKAGEHWKTLAKVGVADIGALADPKNPRINSAIEQWFAERQQTGSVVSHHRVAMRRFVELHGNLPVRQITFEMVEEYRDAIRKLPDHRRLPTKQRGGLTDNLDLPRVSALTVARHLDSVKAFLGFCAEKRWVGANEAKGVRPPPNKGSKAPKRRPFELEERKTVLAQAIKEGGHNGDMPWLIRIAAYTGCRLEELAQLHRNNLRLIRDVWVIEIDDLSDERAVKNAVSVREIPLHPAIRNDFVTRVQAGNSELVFSSFKRAQYDGRFSVPVSGVFGRLMDRAGLSDPRLVFHSLRHTLKREMSDAGVDPDARRAVLGHVARDAHGNYAGHSLQGLARELAKVPSLFGEILLDIPATDRPLEPGLDCGV